jgi:hypothetical protein
MIAADQIDLSFEKGREKGMTWEEIRKQYAGQWVLIEYQELDEQLHVVEGEVMVSSSNKEEIYKHLLKTKGKNIAIEYAGDLSPELTVMF